MRIQIVGTAAGFPHECDGQYVVSYDPDYHWPDGRYDGGWLETTESLEKATNFAPFEALRLLRSGPSCRCHHLRPDGELNRPLTAFTVCIR